MIGEMLPCPVEDCTECEPTEELLEYHLLYDHILPVYSDDYVQSVWDRMATVIREAEDEIHMVHSDASSEVLVRAPALEDTASYGAVSGHGIPPDIGDDLSLGDTASFRVSISQAPSVVQQLAGSEVCATLLSSFA